jgi:acetoin utilization deacetylase AcuC-like enzyme
MLLHSESFRLMTRTVRQAAERLCQGRLVLVHEGGYSEAYVPFCGLAALEELAGVRTAVEDPMLEFVQLQQPKDVLLGFQRQWIDRLAQGFEA